MGGKAQEKKRARTFRSIIAKQQPVVECIADHTMAHQSTTAEVDSFLSSKPLLLPLLALLRGGGDGDGARSGWGRYMVEK